MPQDFASWLSMGGYGGYLWAAYGTALAVLSMLSVCILRGLAATKKRLRELE